MKTDILIRNFLVLSFSFLWTIATSQTIKTDKAMLDRLYKIKAELNSSPEYSNQEKKTSEIVLNHIQKTNPDILQKNVGGYGVIAGYKGNLPGPSVMFRSELDAIKTENGYEHLCGHDGHMTILLGLAEIISGNRDFHGTIYLLFQPAEEIGEGAARMVKDMESSGLKFDYAFALHNNPGYDLNTIVIHEGVYAAGSVGMEIHFKGSPSHAAYPEQAVSPYNAITETAAYMRSLNCSKDVFEGFILGTVVNLVLGEINYGVTPGEGYLRMTLRSFVDSDLDKLCKLMEDFAGQKASEYGLSVNFAYFDKFPATVNDTKANELIVSAAKKDNLQIIYAKEPGRGSDDFAFFATSAISSYFDIGNGKGADIHTAGYKFSPEIIQCALNIYTSLIYDVKIQK